LTASGVNGNGSPARSGTRGLGLLAKPLNGAILHALAHAPKRLVDVRRRCGAPAQTTLRTHLKELEGLGAIAKERRNRFPGALEYELLEPGKELLFVLKVLERWLEQAPNGPLQYGNRGAKAAVKALVEGWSSTILRALAARPLSLTELDGLISGLNYPSLERRLAAMRLAGQVVACDGQGTGTPYRATEWLRRGIAPLAAAARWERRHAPDSSGAVTRVDIEAAFLLSLPLLRLPSEISGACRLGVEMRTGNQHRLVGATAHLEQGRVTFCTARLQGDADAWATGSVIGWLHAVAGADMAGLQMGGDQRFVRLLVEGLHKTLFKPASQRSAELRASA
jgi:DNA-binding HxlR family transcriptional regulator